MSEISLEHSTSLSGIATALAKTQSELKSIKKDASGYGYKYTNICEIADYLLPILSKNDIAVSQFGSGDQDLVTMLIHTKTGEFIKGRIRLPNASELEMKGVNIAQKFGALRTYFKRYSLAEIVGLTSNDEDNDASSEGFKKSDAPKTYTPAAKTAAPEAKKSTTFKRVPSAPTSTTGANDDL